MKTCDYCHGLIPRLKDPSKLCGSRKMGGQCRTDFDSTEDRELYEMLDDGWPEKARDEGEIEHYGDDDAELVGYAHIEWIEEDDGRVTQEGGEVRLRWHASAEWEPYDDDRGGGKWAYQTDDMPHSVERVEGGSK